MAQVKFVRGNKITKGTSWNSKVTTDSIAFDKDNKEIYLGGDKYSQTKLTELTNDNAALQVGDSLNVAFSKLNNIIIDNEEVTAEALNDLNNHKVNTEDLATVATTGSYNDLTDKPNIPVGPMVFKGSLGTGGTITTLPTASSDNTGHTYKVITDGTYANQSAKAGDTFVSDGSTWILIPSGDEPAGTVTSVGMTVPTGLSVTSDSSNPITSSGTFTISYASGYSIPTTTKQTSWDNKISSVKTLKTNNTTAQTASASETLSGSGTINLHKVSKTGSYNDLLNKPTIPTVGTLKSDNTTAQTPSASESFSNTINVHKIAKTGDYKDLLGVTIYVFTGGTEDTTNHCKTITSSPVGSFDEAKTKIQNGEDVYVSWGNSKRIPLHINGRYTNANEESLVAISQDFIFEWQDDTTAKVWEVRYVTDSDLTEVQDFLQDQIDGIILEESDPTVPSHVKAITQQNITDWNNKQNALTFDNVPTANSTNPVTSGGLYTVITNNEKTTSAALNDLNDKKANTADLATVATSGNYNDLTNKPTIPTIPDLSKGTTTGSGNAVTDITVSGHTITLTKGTTFASVASPTFTGTPAAPTAASGTNTTQIATTAFVQQELANFDDEIFIPVSTLPTTNIKTNKIYIVPNSLASPENNLYDEYIYKNNAWELIGTSQIDLNGKQDKLISGTNIKTVNDKSLLGSGDVPIIIEGTYYNGVFTSYTYDANTGYAYQLPAAYTGDTRILYVDTISNVIYRYNGSQYVKLYDFNTDSTPTSGSSNFITSGGVYNALYKSGTTAQRPTTNLVVGMQYFDTTLGQPIWWNGTAWVDALGNTPGSRNYVYVENN